MYLKISNGYERVGSSKFDPLVFLKFGGRREHGEYRRFFKALFFVSKIQASQKAAELQAGQLSQLHLGASLVFPESLEPESPRALSHCSAHL